MNASHLIDGIYKYLARSLLTFHHYQLPEKSGEPPRIFWLIDI